jgi:D-glycero-D-manno-heptose 1,7-bisphosphate phosphatase
MNRRRAVFLDRDGVLNAPVLTVRGPRPPWTLDELTIEHGAGEALGALRDAGWFLVVVTNQPDIAAGRISPHQASRINDEIARLLPVDDIVVCPHATSEHCRCKKPAPGMLLDAARKWSIDLSRSWMVGDRWVDIAAGEKAGVQTLLIEREWSWNPTSAGDPPRSLVPHANAVDIGAATTTILEADAPGPTGARLP